MANLDLSALHVALAPSAGLPAAAELAPTKAVKQFESATSYDLNALLRQAERERAQVLTRWVKGWFARG